MREQQSNDLARGAPLAAPTRSAGVVSPRKTSPNRLVEVPIGEPTSIQTRASPHPKMLTALSPI
jgi:hypothetical protein